MPDTHNALFVALRLVMLVLCAVAGWQALRRATQAKPEASGALLLMAAVLAAGAALSAVAIWVKVLPAPTEPIAADDWAWLVFDLAVPILALRALRLMRQRDAAIAQLEMLSATDPLTGLSNRRGFIAAALPALGRTRRHSAVVVTLDIDRFKQINDGFGHPAGDAVLVAVAQALRGSLRDSDAVGRWGGEEFVVLLPDADLATGKVLAARLLAAVRQRAPHPAGGTAMVTVSAGVALVGSGTPEAALLAAHAAADAALYRAKQNGRDRVEVAD